MAEKRKNDQLEYQAATGALIEAMYDWYVSEPTRDEICPCVLPRLLECARRAVIKAMHTETMEAVGWSDGVTDPTESHYDYILADIMATLKQLEA